jgi:hypothetical protein
VNNEVIRERMTLASYAAVRYLPLMNAETPMKLRDIRDDLRMRLLLVSQKIEAENVRFEAQQQALVHAFKGKIEALKVEAAGLNRLLEVENQRLGEQATSAAAATKPSLPDFMSTVLHERGPKSKEELREMAQQAGYFANSDGGGRAIHATLVNMMRAGRVLFDQSSAKFMLRKQKEFA